MNEDASLMKNEDLVLPMRRDGQPPMIRHEQQGERGRDGRPFDRESKGRGFESRRAHSKQIIRTYSPLGTGSDYLFISGRHQADTIVARQSPSRSRQQRKLYQSAEAVRLSIHETLL